MNRDLKQIVTATSTISVVDAEPWGEYVNKYNRFAVRLFAQHLTPVEDKIFK